MKNKNGKKEVRKSDIDTPPKREFKCSECPKIYKLEGFLKRHLQKHKTDNSCPLPPGRRYTRARTQCESSQSQSVPLLRQRGRSECTSPGRPVSKTPDFYRNLRGEFVCGCGFATLTVKSLMKHQYRHHNVPLLYNCTECSKFFTSAYFLEQHRMGLHEDDVACFICYLEFKSLVDLENHLKLHKACEDTSFECNSCEAIFLKKPDRTKHVKEFHDGRKTITTRKTIQPFLFSGESPMKYSTKRNKVFRHKDLIQNGVRRLDREPYVHNPKFGEVPIKEDRLTMEIFGKPPSSSRKY